MGPVAEEAEVPGGSGDEGDEAEPDGRHQRGARHQAEAPEGHDGGAEEELVEGKAGGSVRRVDGCEGEGVLADLVGGRDREVCRVKRGGDEIGAEKGLVEGRVTVHFRYEETRILRSLTHQKLAHKPGSNVIAT